MQVQGGRRFCFNRALEEDQAIISTKLEDPVARRHYSPDEDEYPNGVVDSTNLGGLSVHCFGRTTGLQGGMVGHTMSSVRIYRRKTFSRSWHVAGGFGVGGDSGAWVVQNGSHRVIGHVLAWCERNHIAYICPMDVLLEDIKKTLGAKRIYLPGSLEEAKYLSRNHSHPNSAEHTKRRQIEAGIRAGGKLDDIQIAVEGLGIVDSAVDMTQAVAGAQASPPAQAQVSPTGGMRRNRLDLPMLNTGASGESGKENLPVLRSRVIKVQEGRKGLEMVGVTP